MLSLATAFVINNIWTLLLGVAFIFNAVQRKDNKPIYYTNLILVVGFALPAIMYAQIVVNVSPLVPIYYLYWAFVNALIVGFLYWSTRANHWPFYSAIKIIMLCITIDVILNLVLHVDRNIIALNGGSTPNFNKESTWSLWTARNVVSNINNGIILFSVLVPFPSRLKRFNGVFKQLLNVIDIKNYTKSNSIVQRIDTIKSMIQQSNNNQLANDYLAAAQELTHRANETQQDFSKPIDLLLKSAANEALKPATDKQHQSQSTSH